MLIDIEGTDGSGKATQTKLLFNYLTGLGYKCKLISFPNYASPSSGPVKMYLAGELGENSNITGHQASVLYAVDRLATMRQVDVDNYDFILFDRYTPSNMIYQSTRLKTNKEIDEFLAWVSDFEYGKLKLPRPDKIVFLDMPVEFSEKLARARGELKNGMKKDILEVTSEQQKAYASAKYVAKKDNWITISCVDKGLKSIEQIHKEILTNLGLLCNINQQEI